VATHTADLELAKRCAAGDSAAWDTFVLDYRPVLYRAADALDPSGGARDLADSLYAELYGVNSATGERQSLFRYFQGRSSLATWLRAVLAQRYVDRLRASRRLEPLPEDGAELERVSGRAGAGTVAMEQDPERPRYMTLITGILLRVIARLDGKERLRLACYYVQELTLAEIGRILEEHEATLSRQLARTRRAIRASVERELRDEAGLGDRELHECLAAVAADPGEIDLAAMLRDGRESAPPVRERIL
jgi:RNA polymerase sigma factor (sigma-70 family)